MASAEDVSIKFERQMEVSSRCGEAARETWQNPIVLPDVGGVPGYDVAVVAGGIGGAVVLLVVVVLAVVYCSRRSGKRRRRSGNEPRSGSEGPSNGNEELSRKPRNIV